MCKVNSFQFFVFWKDLLRDRECVCLVWAELGLAVLYQFKGASATTDNGNKQLQMSLCLLKQQRNINLNTEKLGKYSGQLHIFIFSGGGILA